MLLREKDSDYTYT